MEWYLEIITPRCHVSDVEFGIFFSNFVKKVPVTHQMAIYLDYFLSGSVKIVLSAFVDLWLWITVKGAWEDCGTVELVLFPILFFKLIFGKEV